MLGFLSKLLHPLRTHGIGWPTYAIDRFLLGVNILVPVPRRPYRIDVKVEFLKILVNPEEMFQHS